MELMDCQGMIREMCWSCKIPLIDQHYGGLLLVLHGELQEKWTSSTS